MMVRFFQATLRLYYWIVSPWLGNRCRYVPSCSEYSHQALQQHGVVKGLWLTLRRLSRCHPWGGHGHDPVPDKCKKIEAKGQFDKRSCNTSKG